MLFAGFLIFDHAEEELIPCTIKILEQNFPRGTLYFFLICLLHGRKNVKFYCCHSIQWCILVERMRETEKNATFPASIGHICQEKKTSKLAKEGLRIAQLLFDFIKHAVAHFGPFRAPFLLVLTILCFQDTRIC